MAVFAVVPVKRLSVSKRRLSAVLNPEERSLLSVAMLEDVLAALKASTVHETVVVSNDLVVREVADKFGFSYFSAVATGLNPAVEEATDWCMGRQADSVLILPADIPLVSHKDINKIVALGSDKAFVVVLCPSRNGGTNALFKKPANLIRACFGPNSFMKHVQEACKKQVNVRFHYSVGTATDIDSVEDLKKLYEIENNTVSRQVLEQILKLHNHRSAFSSV
jgi:2-phospho-L-lactate guanylyltransferase